MKEKEGICPYCGGDVIEYDHLDWLNDDSVSQECHCMKCNRYFEQIYTTTFEGQDYEFEEEEIEDANS